MNSIAYISLGSNVGDSPGYLREALMKLARIGTPVTNSDFYRTKPWGKIRQPYFYNAVAALDMGKRLDPQRLLYALLAIEAEYERVRIERWGPRTLDLDLLLYDDIVEKSAQCIVPHPHLRARAFVLAPLAEIAPNLAIPPDGAKPEAVLGDLPFEERAGVTRLPHTGHLPPPRHVNYDAPAGPASNYESFRRASEFDSTVFETVGSAIRFGPKMRILDVGCGTGRFTRLFAQRQAIVTGIDSSQAMLAQAHEASPGDNPSYVLGDAVHTLPGKNWDAVTAFFSVQHFSSLERFLALAKQKLASNGTLAIASFPHRHFCESPFCEFFPSFAGIDMARFPSAPALVRLLREAGFAQIEQHDVTGEVAHDFPTLDQLVKNKYLSTFHLLDEAEFQNGVAAMRAAWGDKDRITRSLMSAVVSAKRP
jgi:2-amino-4-hydroxy-6-hydroxymethyldihydropteridine diphosphokinase